MTEGPVYGEGGARTPILVDSVDNQPRHVMELVSSIRHAEGDGLGKTHYSDHRVSLQLVAF